MNRGELVAYLCNLHALMQAIDPTPAWMAEEYAKHWDLYKKEVKDNANERH